MAIQHATHAEVQEVAKELHKLADKVGIVTALYLTFGQDVIINMRMTKELENTEITTFPFESSIGNVIGRWTSKHGSDLRLKAFVNMVTSDLRYREPVYGFGTKKQNALKTWIVDVGWETMDEKRRDEFCESIIEANCYFSLIPGTGGELDECLFV